MAAITLKTVDPADVPTPASGKAAILFDSTASNVLSYKDSAGATHHVNTGSGDVAGPSSAVNNHVVFFDSTTGKLIKDSGLTLSGTNTGDQTSVTGNAGTATALANARTISITGDLAYTSPSFDGTGNVTAAGTLATVNGNVGSFGGATKSLTGTFNAKGLVTAIAEQTVTPAVGSITGLGTGIATALGVNVGTAGAPVVNGGALGTPSSGTLSSCTGLPVGSVTGLGTGVATALAVNVGSAGAPVVFNGALGTPSSGTLSSCTSLPVSTGISGLGTGVATFLATPSSANLASALTDETGSGAAVFATSPTLVTPNLGVATADAYKVSSTGHIVDSSTSRTLSGTDNGCFIHFSSGSTITLNMAGSLGAFACTVIQEGAGQITFAANSQTMTVRGSLTKTSGAAAFASIVSRTSGTFLIDGSLA